MSIISRISNRPHRTKTHTTHDQKRETHKTKSYEYVQYYLKNSKFDQLANLAKKSNVAEFPNRATTVLKLESSFREQELIPLVSSFPSVLTPSIKLATAVATQNDPAAKDIFSVIRANGSLGTHYEEMIKVFEILDSSVEKPDIEKLMRERLISGNYALFSNLEQGEAALYYGFTNRTSSKTDLDFGRRKAQEMAGVSLVNSGVPPKEVKEILSSKEFIKLLENFNSLPIGNILVFGLTKQAASKHLYDSHPYGRPTGHDAVKVVEGIEGNDRLHAQQARLVLSEECLIPNNGITIISLEDEEIVDNHLMKAKKQAFIPPYYIPGFDKLLPVGSTQRERDEIAERKSLLNDTKKLTYDILQVVKSNSSKR